MSEENVEVVRAMYASLSAVTEGGDADYVVLAHFDPDCEYRPVEEIDAIHGREALIRYVERWLEAWADFRYELDEIIDAGDLVVAGTTSHARGSESGMWITQPLFHVFEMRKGKILRMHEYLERGHAFEVAGLSE